MVTYADLDFCRYPEMVEFIMNVYDFLLLGICIVIQIRSVFKNWLNVAEAGASNKWQIVYVVQRQNQMNGMFVGVPLHRGLFY